jgi:hypothetical protein
VPSCGRAANVPGLDHVANGALDLIGGTPLVRVTRLDKPARASCV